MKIAIIGAGPAGIACAVQLKRMGWEADIFEKNRIGGLLHNAGVLTNYLGYPYGVTANSIIERIEMHAENYDLNIIREEIEKISFRDDEFQLVSAHKNYIYNIVVIASGTIPNSISWVGKYPDRVFYDVVPIRKKRKSEISIIGGGDAAFDYALQLQDKNKVSIFNRSENLRCLKSLQDEVSNKVNINYHPNFILHDVDLQDNKLSLTFHCEKKISVHITDYLIFAVGREANRAFIDDHIAVNKQDKLVKEKKLYFAGDVINGEFRQLSVASGDGVKIAMQISKKLKIKN